MQTMTRILLFTSANTSHKSQQQIPMLKVLKRVFTLHQLCDLARNKNIGVSFFVHYGTINRYIRSISLGGGQLQEHLEQLTSSTPPKMLRSIEYTVIVVKLPILLFSCKRLSWCKTPIILRSIWFCQLHSMVYCGCYPMIENNRFLPEK